MTFYSTTMPRKKSSHVFQILSRGAAVLTAWQGFSMGRGEAEAIALALVEKAQFLGIDHKNGIHACKLLGVAFTTAVSILIRSREKGLLDESEVLEKLASLETWTVQGIDYRGCETEIGGKAMSKTMSVRMDRDNYDFLHEITKEEGSDLSKAVRDMVTRGRILLAVERYKTGEASLGRAAELAGVPLVQMMTILTEFGVESRLEKEDYLQGLKNLQRSGERGRVRAESAVERRWHKSRRIPARSLPSGAAVCTRLHDGALSVSELARWRSGVRVPTAS